MAITFLKRKKIQKYLILVFIIAILALFLVIWYGFLKKPKPTAPSPIYVPPKKIEIDFGVLKNPFLRESQPFEEIKPFEETKLPEEKTERENPFIPY